MFRTAGRIPFWFLRLGPALATVMTSLAVTSAETATSGYALFYVWVGLYVFYFPISPGTPPSTWSGHLANYALRDRDHADQPTGRLARRGPPFRHHRGTLITAASSPHLPPYPSGAADGQSYRCGANRPVDRLAESRCLHEALERELERAKPESRHVSVLMLDIDRFKRINEGQGLAAGDRLLRRVAIKIGAIQPTHRLRRSLREARNSPICCRRPISIAPTWPRSSCWSKIRASSAGPAGSHLSCIGGVAVFPDQAPRTWRPSGCSRPGASRRQGPRPRQGRDLQPGGDHRARGDGRQTKRRGPGSARDGAQPRRGAGPAGLRHRQPRQTVGALCELMARGARTLAGPGRASPAGGDPPRHRQDRRAGLDPSQGRAAQ